MKKLLVYLKDYKKESVLGPLFKLLEATFELIVPLVMAAIIDTGVATGDKSYIMKMCMVLVLLAVIGLTCSITEQNLAAKAAVGFATKLRHALFAHIESLSFTEMDTVGTATLITRMTSDVNQVQNGVNLVLRLFLRSPFIVFGAMVMAFTIDVKAALVFVVTIQLLSIIVFGIMLISIPLYKKVQSALDKVLGITRENLTGSRVIRAFNKEDDEIVHFNENNDLLTRAQIYVGKISALMNPLTYVIIIGAIVVLVWTGAVRDDKGYITQGEVVELLNYISQIFSPVDSLGMEIQTIQSAIAGIHMINEFFALEEKQIVEKDSETVAEECVEQMAWGHSENKTADVPFVEFRDVTFGYDEHVVLDHLNLKVMDAEQVTLAGRTGAGKSTILKLLLGLYEPQGGEVLIHGRPAAAVREEEKRKLFGYVEQTFHMVPGTVREQITLYDETIPADLVKAVAELTGLDDVIESSENGYDTKCTPELFSQGQWQLLSIARAAVAEPQMLLFDEITANLDAETEKAVLLALKRVAKDRTVISISHRTSAELGRIIYL